MTDAEFVAYWRSLDWRDRSETDVREAFAARLLFHLGYAMGSLYDVLTEKNLALPYPYLKIGSQKSGRIDYLPTVRKRGFWLMEVKRPSNDLSQGVIEQAYLYAIHPDVRARYIVLTNGHSVKIFDVFTTDEDDYRKPFFTCSREDAPLTLPGLAKLIGAKSISVQLRRRSLEAIRDALGVENDLEEVDAFDQEFRRMLDTVRPIVRRNEQEDRRAEAFAALKADEERRRTISWDELLRELNIPGNASVAYGVEAGRRLAEAQVGARREMVVRMAQLYRGRPHSVFRAHGTAALLELLMTGSDVTDPLYVRSLPECIEELVHGATTYFQENELSNVLVHFDNASIRLSYRFVRKLGPESVFNIVSRIDPATAKAMGALTRPADRVISASNALADGFLWRAFVGGTTEHVRDGLRQVLAVESLLEPIATIPYPTVGDSDMLSFECYGKGHDMLLMGTWDALHSRREFIEDAKLSDEVLTFARLDSEAARTLIPPEPSDRSAFVEHPLLRYMAQKIMEHRNSGVATQ